jgi:Mn2+/Fe2+ NRAMP family transporter
MGADANRIGVKIIGWLITGAIVALNAVLIVGVLTGA